MNLNEVESRFIFAQNFDMIEKCKSLIAFEKPKKFYNYFNYMREIAKVSLWKKFLKAYKFKVITRFVIKEFEIVLDNKPTEYIKSFDFYFDMKCTCTFKSTGNSDNWPL